MTRSAFLAAALLVAACSSVEGVTAPGPATAPSPTNRTTDGVPSPSSTDGPAATPSTVEHVPTGRDERPLPATPQDLATDLTTTERTIRDPAAGLDDALAAGRHLQRLYSLLGRNPEWADEVLNGVGADIAPDVADHWEARRSLSSLVTSTTLATHLPAWRIVQPLPPDELMALYREAEAETGVGWQYLAAINLVETRMGRIVGYSTAGAVGPMQFLSSTWAECCVGDPRVPADAIRGAAVYLTHRGAPIDMARALRGYNNSDHYVTAVSAYARIMERDPLAYRGFWAFEVYFLTASGVVHLPVGYDEAEPVAVEDWLAGHPDELVGS